MTDPGQIARLGDPVGARRASRPWIAGIVMLALLAGGAAYFALAYRPAERQALIESWARELESLAEVRKLAIERWLGDALGDARTIAAFPSTIALATRRSVSPAPAEADARHLSTVLTTFAQIQGYRDAAIVDAELRLIAHSEPAAAVEEACLKAAREAIERGAFTTDLYANSASGSVVSFVAPILDPGVGGRPVGAAILTQDPRHWLYPYLSAPTTVSSAEALLIRRQGDDILYLSPLKRDRRPVLSRRRPVRSPGQGEIDAQGGQDGFSAYRDYSGVPVFAVTRRLGREGWGLVVKVEQREALAPFEARMRNTALTWGALSAMLAASVLALIWGLQRSQEARLARSHAELALLLDQANDAVLFLSRDGRIRDVNRRAETLYGCTREELLRMTVADLCPAETRAAAASQLGEVLARGSLVFETMHRHGDGLPFPVEVSSRLVPWRGGEGILSIVRDVTERKRAEAQILRLNRLLRTLFEVDEAIVRAEHRDTLFQEVCRILAERGSVRMAWIGVLDETSGNVRPVAQAGAGLDYLEGLVVRRDDSPEGQGPIGRALRSGAPAICQDVASDPRMLPWRERQLARGYRSSGAFPFRWGAALGVLSAYLGEPDAFGTDETDLFVELASDLGYALEALEHRAERRRAEEALRDTQRQFVQAQKMEAVGRLAGGVAHDFNNLLSVIVGYGGLVRRTLPPEDPRAGKLDQVLRAAERAAGLTRQLLAFSRRQVLQPKVLDLNLLVSEMEKMLRRLIGEDVELRTSLGFELGSVMADPGQVEQVLMNLVVNARDAMPAGGQLTIRTDNAVAGAGDLATGEAVSPGGYVLLAVSDTGCGMDSGTLARIFEPFFTTKSPDKGTGLGLATAYGIVTQSGGHIRVESALQIGTTFRVYLPRVDQPGEVESRPTLQDLPRGSETLLLAEDEEVLRELMRDTLEGCGYTVLVAPRAEDGVALAERHAGVIHLLVTDVIMPGISGRELAARITAARPDTRVLYVSGYTADVIASHGVLEPGIAFLQKPFTSDALARKVREVLAQA